MRPSSEAPTSRTPTATSPAMITSRRVRERAPDRHRRRLSGERPARSRRDRSGVEQTPGRISDANSANITTRESKADRVGRSGAGAQQRRSSNLQRRRSGRASGSTSSWPTRRHRHRAARIAISRRRVARAREPGRARGRGEQQQPHGGSSTMSGRWTRGHWQGCEPARCRRNGRRPRRVRVRRPRFRRQLSGAESARTAAT
jgi:hypothetical protein